MDGKPIKQIGDGLVDDDINADVDELVDSDSACVNRFSDIVGRLNVSC